MKNSHIIILFTLLFNLYSCKDDNKVANVVSNESLKKDSIPSKSEEKKIEISLESVKKDLPTFGNAEADKFVTNTKKYFEEVAEATKKGDNDKVLELQLKSVDIDSEFNKVKSKLPAEQQKQLSDWYMKLVNAASE